MAIHEVAQKAEFQLYPMSACQADAAPYPERDLPEDSLIRKICACIPIIGIFVAIKNEYSLKTKLVEELSLDDPDIEYVTRALEVSNHYRIASLVRAMCTAIIGCIGLYSEIMTEGLNLFTKLYVGFVAPISTNFSMIYFDRNEEVIRALREDDQATSQITETKVSLISYIAQNLI